MNDLERNIVIAESIKPLIQMADISLENLEKAGISIDQLEEGEKKMQWHNSHLAAWPFPETMRKAEIMQAQTDTYYQIIKLLKIRKQQQEIQSQPDETPGAHVLKKLGF